jgi:hypothetical protein
MHRKKDKAIEPLDLFKIHTISRLKICAVATELHLLMSCIDNSKRMDSAATSQDSFP